MKKRENSVFEAKVKLKLQNTYKLKTRNRVLAFKKSL